MSGPSQIGVSSDVTSGEQSAISSLLGLANTQQGEASQLFNIGLPAEQQAVQHYQELASGSPEAIQTAIAPGVQQIQQAAQGAKQNILNTAPSGGEKNLAIENVDVNQGNEIGKLASQGYLGSFNALGQLGAQTMGQSETATGQALSGITSAISGYGQVGNQELQGQQLQLQQKGEQLGFSSDLLGDATALGTAGIAKCWVAAELFDGWFEPRTVLVRRWIREVSPRTWIGRRLAALYLRFGQRMAVHIRTHLVARCILRLVFDRLLVAARRHYGEDARV